MNVLICDDERRITEQVSELLQKHCTENGMQVRFHLFDDPCAIKDLAGYDIAILDIDMGDFSGIDLARRLRNEKPGIEDAVREVVRKKQIITISVNSEWIDIPINHILYLESNLRIVIMHLIHDERTEYRFYGNMTDLSEKLEDLGFLRIQKSFLVNMEYIEQMQYEKVRLRGGIVLPSSAKNHKELKQHYLKWRGKNRWAIS